MNVRYDKGNFCPCWCTIAQQKPSTSNFGGYIYQQFRIFRINVGYIFLNYGLLTVGSFDEIVLIVCTVL